jgi:hypothetical protein
MINESELVDDDDDDVGCCSCSCFTKNIESLDLLFIDRDRFGLEGWEDDDE